MSTTLTRRSLLTRAGAAVLAVPAIAAILVDGAKASQAEWDAFFNAGFDTCDAELLSQYWNMDLDATKANAGAKILRGDKRILRQAIKEAGRRFNCTVGFNYNDSDTIADLWKSA